MRARFQSPIADGILLFLVAWMPRLALAFFAPTAGGDWRNSYHPLALNILRNGCISLSDPATGLCAPSWGGNQAPGFSAFVAATWKVLPQSAVSVLVVQSALVALAIVAVHFAVRQLTQSRAAGWMVGLVLAFWPQHMA